MNDRERVRTLVDGELSAAQEAELMAAAARKPELAHAIAEAKELSSQLALLSSIDRGTPPEDLVERSVRSAIRARAEYEARPRGFFHWLERPVTVRMGSLVAAGALLAAGAIFALRLLPRAHGGDERASATTPEPASARPAEEAGTTIEAGLAPVRFVLPAQGAASVAVAGDFNGWTAESSPLRDEDGDGVFVGTLRLPPGTYAYMFVVDGQRWVSDPYATNFREDDFGNRNAVLRIN